jgi:hypothetical protein
VFRIDISTLLATMVYDKRLTLLVPNVGQQAIAHGRKEGDCANEMMLRAGAPDPPCSAEEEA